MSAEMANYEDFLGSFTLESPDFKRALKILIKYEIHVLVGIVNFFDRVCISKPKF